MPERLDHADFVAEFVPGLLNPAEPTPESVTGHSGKSAVKRFNVYRNNVTASLVAAIRDVYPSTCQALGEKASQAAALTYVRAHPPTSKLLFEYGRGFAEHLREGGFTEKAPWLSDVARLERAWLDAYHAADATPLAPEALGAVPHDKLGEAVFRSHPATRIVPCDTPAVSIMVALKNGAPLEDAPSGGAETALITRPALAVDVRALSGTIALFLSTLADGKSLGEAAELAAEAGEFDLGGALGLVLQSGAFSSIDVN